MVSVTGWERKAQVDHKGQSVTASVDLCHNGICTSQAYTLVRIAWLLPCVPSRALHASTREAAFTPCSSRALLYKASHTRQFLHLSEFSNGSRRKYLSLLLRAAAGAHLGFIDILPSGGTAIDPKNSANNTGILIAAR